MGAVVVVLLYVRAWLLLLHTVRSMYVYVYVCWSRLPSTANYYTIQLAYIA